MADIIEVKVAPIDLKLTAGESAEVTATLRNLGETIDQLTLQVEELAPEWYHLPVSSVSLFPNDQDSLKISISPPPTSETQSGTYPFRIKVTSQDHPTEVSTVDLNLEIRALPGFKVTISPQRNSGYKGVYQISATNTGDREVTLGLKASDAQGLLRYYLKPEIMNIPAGDSSESTLEVQLGWRDFFGGTKEFEFEVQVASPEVDEIRTVNGQLVRLPWYKTLSRLRLPHLKLPRTRLSRIRMPNIPLPWLQRPPEISTFETTTDDNREFKLSWAVKRATEVRLDDEDVELQGERLENPTEAKSYVLIASNKHGSLTRVIEVQPASLPETKFAERIGITLSPKELQATAGGTPVIATLNMQNLGEIVDKLQVEIDGLAETWYNFSALNKALMPNTADQVQIIFTPPKTKGVKAKTYPFAVTVRSESNPEEASSIVGQIEVLPSEEFKLDIRPYRISCRRKGTFRVNLANTDVSDIDFALEATDLDAGLRFHFNDNNPVVGAWNQIEVPMVARPKKGKIIGELIRYDITVTAVTGQGNSQSTRCELNYKPLISSWRPIFRAIKWIVILVIIGGVLYSLLQFGGGWGMLLSSPQAWFKQLVYSIKSWF